MRISTKVTLGLGLTSTFILGGYGFWQYAQEQRDLKAAAEQNFRTLGAAVQLAVGNSLRDKQSADVRHILDSMEVGEPEIDAFVIDPAGSVTADSFGGDLSAESFMALIADFGLEAALAEEAADPLVRFEGASATPRLIGLFPLWGEIDNRLGALVIIRPLKELADDLERTRNIAMVSSVVVIGSITFIGWLLLLTYVRVPLESVNRALRAVRAGDLTLRLPARRKDELGSLAMEFNAMVRELEQARHQLITAAESRGLLEQALQHVDKLITVGQLSAGLAHEIGSPLQILSGRAAALSARHDLPADVIRTARILDEQSSRIARIVDQLLTFARRKTPHLADIDVGPPITAIVDLLEGEARRAGVHLEYHCPAALPKITADADQIQQIVMNLLSNALRATARNGRVRVSLAESSFPTADGMHAQPSVMLAIEDNGRGMSEAVRTRIFEPFFTAWSEAGTGLGLAVVKSIVDDHGGSIVITTAQGRGTTVLVHLPSSARVRERSFVA